MICDPGLHTCGDVGPGYDGVGGVTFAPNTGPSCPPAATIPPAVGLGGNPGVMEPGSRSSLSPALLPFPCPRASSRTFCNKALSLFRFFNRTTTQTTQAIIRTPATLADIAPTLALTVIWPSSLSSSSSSELEYCVAAAGVSLLVLVVVKVVATPALVVVIVLVTVVKTDAEFAAARNSASDMESGVFVSEQLSCMISYIWVKKSPP